MLWPNTRERTSLGKNQSWDSPTWCCSGRPLALGSVYPPPTQQRFTKGSIGVSQGLQYVLSFFVENRVVIAPNSNVSACCKGAHPFLERKFLKCLVQLLHSPTWFIHGQEQRAGLCTRFLNIVRFCFHFAIRFLVALQQSDWTQCLGECPTGVEFTTSTLTRDIWNM